ncbi:hypothetical protein JK205_04105 [Gluconobacter cerinus]|uniref:reverse transcriptase domain-containing protein n=1 Tax=Gluconobacter cerinus TaxID=38307 RepID=UPI001B8BD656|nr:reverse transcriptase domain-containing protein [Gluconobacter cerinus]MBS1018121.1 hypothetical protein [Gluconobacter cerinus]
MLKSIQNQIELEAKKRLNKFKKKQATLKKYRSLFEKRTGKLATVTKEKFVPISEDKHFNPYYCIKHSKFLAKGIYKSIIKGNYKPREVIRLKKPKKDGKFRNIDVFSITDSAVSKIFFKNIRKRNEKLFSDSSYAYFLNKKPLDAVIRIRNILSLDKVFISQYDFSDYFGSMKHGIINSIMNEEKKFLITNVEKKFIRSTISFTFKIYKSSEYGKNLCGIPQGSSISLFLANIFADKLDTSLRFSSGEFVRFADDSIVVNGSYEDSINCYNIYKKYAENREIKINEVKSSGINLFSKSQGEIRTINNFTFLGYKFLPESIDISDSSIVRIKNRCSKIIYNHLILHPKRARSINLSRLGSGLTDWDLVTCINELRRYIYGRHSERAIRNFINGDSSISKFYNTISYFCLSENEDTFKYLDGWLVSQVYYFYQERRKLLKSYGIPMAPISRKKLISGLWYSSKKIPNETKIPSFYLAWRAAKRSWALHGLHGVQARYQYAYADK